MAPLVAIGEASPLQSRVQEPVQGCTSASPPVLWPPGLHGLAWDQGPRHGCPKGVGSACGSHRLITQNRDLDAPRPACPGSTWHQPKGSSAPRRFGEEGRPPAPILLSLEPARLTEPSVEQRGCCVLSGWAAGLQVGRRHRLLYDPRPSLSLRSRPCSLSVHWEQHPHLQGVWAEEITAIKCPRPWHAAGPFVLVCVGVLSAPERE